MVLTNPSESHSVHIDNKIKTMTKLTKKQKVEKILNLIRKMEQNTFLMPESWSELYNMATRTAHYKTYVGQRGDNDRYIDIEYTRNDEIYNPKQKDCFSIKIIKNEVYVHKRLGDSSNEVDLVLDIVEAIYKEKMSFEIMDKISFEKREKMTQIKNEIKSKTEEFEKIKKELADKPKKLIR